MDLNAQPPHSWTIEEGPYEIADYCLSQGTNVLVLLNAWLDSGTDAQEDYDRHTQLFWTARLRPLWERSGVVNDSKAGKGSPARPVESSKETLVIICNRTGEENGKHTSLPKTYQLTSFRQDFRWYFQHLFSASRCATGRLETNGPERRGAEAMDGSLIDVCRSIKLL